MKKHIIAWVRSNASQRSGTPRTSGATRRSGAAYLLLVVALLLVVMGATQAMLRGEIASQRNRQRQMQTDTLQRAISAAMNSDHDWDSPVELPLDDRQRITIETDQEQAKLTAHWMSGETIQNTVVRPFVSASELAKANEAESDETDRPSDPEI